MDDKILKNTKLLYLIVFMTMLNLFAPIEVIYIQNKGIPISIVSILNLTVPLSCALLEIPTGIIGDIIGRKKVLLLSQFSFLLSSTILLFANTALDFFMVYMLEGLGWSLFSGNNDAIIVEQAICKKVNVGKQLAFFYSGITLGSIVSGMFNSSFSFVLKDVDFKFFIYVFTVFRSIAFIISFFIKVDVNIEKNTHNNPMQIFKQSFKIIKKNGGGILLIFYEATGRLTFYLPVIVQPLLYRQGISIFYFGIIYTSSQIVTFMIQRKADSIIRYFSRKKILRYSPIILSLGLLFILTNKIYCIILGMFCIQVVSPLRHQSLEMKKNEMVNNHIRSTYLSTISFCVLILNTIMLAGIGIVLEYNFLIGMMILMVLTASIGLYTQKKFFEVKKI